nr:MAG TPA: hypothetical protein [Caudoviricetes sp.]
MEYSERILIRDFVLDYLIEDGGVIEAEADRVQEALEAGLEGDSAWWDPEAPLAPIDAFTGAPIPPGAPDTRLLTLLFRVFDPIAHCEYTCDLTLWYERIAQDSAA